MRVDGDRQQIDRPESGCLSGAARGFFELIARLGEARRTSSLSSARGCLVTAPFREGVRGAFPAAGRNGARSGARPISSNRRWKRGQSEQLSGLRFRDARGRRRRAVNRPNRDAELTLGVAKEDALIDR
jgi:hypothetical protein